MGNTCCHQKNFQPLCHTAHTRHKTCIHTINSLSKLSSCLQKELIYNMNQFRDVDDITITQLQNEIQNATWVVMKAKIKQEFHLVGSLRYFEPDQDIKTRLHLDTSRVIYISAVVITEQYRGRGYVQQLLAFVIHKIPKKYKIVLEVDAEYIPAIKAYEKAGFKRISTYKYHDQPTMLMQYITNKKISL
jgi:ribosomal protein S18 acetylase RimI-like enzyme